MSYDLKVVRLDKLNIPAETLRRDSSPAGDEKLQRSLEKYGVLVPLVVTPLGRGEYAVWDGTRRVRNLRELGFPGTTEIPALVSKGDDADSVIAQVNINQTRERLSTLAEAEALRQLVQDHGKKQVEAAEFLLKTKGWASQVMRVWKLPKNIQKDIRSGELPLSHAIIISRYLKNPAVLNLLHTEAKKGNISSVHLAALGRRAEKDGLVMARKHRPRRVRFGKKSWVRLEPLQKGFRAEIHFDETDDPKSTLRELAKLIEKMS